MGYMLHFPNYNYQEYHNRVTRDKTQPFYIEKVYQVQKDVNHHSFNDGKSRKNDDSSFSRNESEDYNSYESTSSESIFYQSKNSPQPKQVEKVFAEVTGKGRRFSETT